MFWNSAAQGANLQLARKSTHLPKCLLILKGPSEFFLGGANSRSHGFVWAEKSRSGVLVTNSKMPTIVTWSECERLLSCYCYATKTNSRTIREQVSQPVSAGKGADMSELQSHHCVFEQINDIGTAVHGHLQFLWSVGCQTISVSTFLIGASAKLKREHVKRYAVALSV